MEAVLERTLEIGPSICDASGKLSRQDAFGVFMDIATAHATRLGVGPDEMFARDLFWLTVKTKLIFHSRPRMGQSVLVRTWPEKPERVRCVRSYEMMSDGKTLIAGKTEWAVMNVKTGRIVSLEGLFPEELCFPERSACEEPFAVIAPDFATEEEYASYHVRSTDIDLGGHMNNVAYIRAVLGSFSSAELKQPVREMDAIFRTPCFEGELLGFRRKRTKSGWDICTAKDGNAALFLRMA